MLKRVEDVSNGIATAFRATATVEHIRGAPTPINDEALAEVLVTYAKELLPEEKVVASNVPKGVGDDFAYVGELVPAVLFDLGFASDEEGYKVTGHQPNVVFNEEALPLGAAIHTYLAMRWLEQH
jgi:metal-dependent amidase/aminoacylase/carboxypeptidase family protein